MNPRTLLILAIAIGSFLAGLCFTPRYEHVQMGGGYPARFDRWTGRLELITISTTAEFARTVPGPSPFSPDAYLAGR